MKKCLAVLFLMGMVSISQANLIGGFETGMDNWGPTWEGGSTFAIGSTPGTVTEGSNSVAVTLSQTGYWKMQWNAPVVPPASLTNAYLTFDLTMFASEWAGPNNDLWIWTKVADKIAITSDGPQGWVEWTSATAIDRVTGLPTSTDWGRWSGDAIKSYRLDIPSYNLTGATWFQINISIQANNPPSTGNFYFDNIQLVPEPASMAMLGLGGVLALLRKRK